MLEKYVAAVFDHLVEEDVSAALLSFSAMPDTIRDFILVDATIGMNNRLSFLRGSSDRLNYVAGKLELVVKYKDASPFYTALGFSPKGSNVSHEDIKKAFRTFGVIDAWGKMNTLAAALGGAALSLEENYKNLASARHKAAHDPISSIPVADLQSNIRSAIVIGICCDVMAKNAGSAIRICRHKKNLETDVAAYARAMRFLDEQQNSSWLERPSVGSRGTKAYPDRATGIAGARARVAKPFVIVRDKTGQPIELAG
ncbi:hypothetical protein [Aureimonas glaciei]|nr:hypothetical protein [Aureimonas glaciei]